MDYADADTTLVATYLNPAVWNYGKSTGFDHTHIVSVKEHAVFQFRWELYNAFNHPGFQGVNSNASFAAPGATTQLNGQFGQITSTNGLPRVMQGSVRITF
jgi:hypothetical protein